METIYDIDRNNAVMLLNDYPYFLLTKIEMETGQNLTEFRDELLKIQRDYILYKKGAGFQPEGSKGDYVPSTLRFKTMKNLIDKEARFMFSQTPDIKVISQETNVEDALKQFQSLIDKVIEKNNISKTLLQAAKDCFIGKRVACLVELNGQDGVRVRFYDSLHFYHEQEVDSERLVRFVCFKKLKKYDTKRGHLYYVKEYEKTKEGVTATVSVYDGLGVIVETETTKLDLDEIPAVVITNDGVLSDEEGTSEIEEMEHFESVYSLLGNGDIDSLRKGENPIYATIDMNPETTKNLSSAPGSFWDLHSNQNEDNIHPSVQTLETKLNYSEPVKATLQRIRQAMFSMVDVPDISEEGLLSGITSFKALKALYYPLSVRCDEKMKTWIPAIQKIFGFVLTFGILEPELINGIYALALDKNQKYEIMVQQNYALLEDENEEKEIDLTEVQAKAMSVLSYLKKWRSEDLKTDKQRQDELMQIAVESNMLDAASLNMGVSTELTRRITDEDMEKDIEVVETQKKKEGQTKETILEKEVTKE